MWRRMPRTHPSQKPSLHPPACANPLKRTKFEVRSGIQANLESTYVSIRMQHYWIATQCSDMSPRRPDISRPQIFLLSNMHVSSYHSNIQSKLERLNTNHVVLNNSMSSQILAFKPWTSTMLWFRFSKYHFEELIWKFSIRADWKSTFRAPRLHGITLESTWRYTQQSSTGTEKICIASTWSGRQADWKSVSFLKANVKRMTI